MNMIEAICVNHNTSKYCELMIKSLYFNHDDLSNIALKLYDNASLDDISSLVEYTSLKKIPIIQTGYTTRTKNNSHGELLRRFVLEQPDCEYYLFLDSDTCFLEKDTINTMLVELKKCPDAFGIGPRLSWDGINEIPEEARKSNKDICTDRLHPCCALIKNTDLFRNIVEDVGLSGFTRHWAEYDESIDTFKMMTKIMKTHNLKHIISNKMILHFFCVSYVWGDSEKWKVYKDNRRDNYLQKYTV